MKAGRPGYAPGMDLRRVAVPVAALLLGGLLTGCGSGEELISSSTADSLHAQVQGVREALAAGRDGAAESRVANLREDIRRLAASGELDPEDALALLAQVDRLATGLEKRATPTPTPTPTPKPTPVPKRVTAADSGDGPSWRDGKSDRRGDAKPKGKAKVKGKGRGR